MLSRSGGRWVTTTNANPLPPGTDLKNCSSASRPPAEAPMPTMGRLGIMIFILTVYASYFTHYLHPFNRMFGVSVPNILRSNCGPMQVIVIEGERRAAARG